MATYSSTLAWKIPWTEEPSRLQSMGSLGVGHDWATSLSLFTFTLEKEMATHSSVLAWRIPGTEEPGGLPSLGSHRVEHNWSDLAAAASAFYRGTTDEFLPRDHSELRRLCFQKAHPTVLSDLLSLSWPSVHLSPDILLPQWSFPSQGRILVPLQRCPSCRWHAAWLTVA